MRHLDIILPPIKRSVLAVLAKNLFHYNHLSVILYITFYVTQTHQKLHISQGHLTWKWKGKVLYNTKWIASHAHGWRGEKKRKYLM